MIETEVVLEALSALCIAGVTSAQTQTSEVASVTAASVTAAEFSESSAEEAELQLPISDLSIHDLVPLAISGFHRSLRSRNQNVLGTSLPDDIVDNKTGGIDIQIKPEDFQWSKENLDPGYNYDFTNLKDTETYYRGGEVYARPCGWQRFALKVLDKYDDNTWLGHAGRSTQSVSGEWPVSYHGTQEKFVKAIVEESYKKGWRKAYGPGVYSTPHIKIAESYAHEFTAKTNGKKYKVIMQNRINPKIREICKGEPRYWLVPVPEGTSKEEEQKIVKKAIRPYGLVLKEVP